MQWSVVASGRVSATPQQLLLSWLLSPVTLRPRGTVTQKTAVAPREGQVLSCCVCLTAPGIHVTRGLPPRLVQAPHAHRAFPPRFQQVAFEGVRGQKGLGALFILQCSLFLESPVLLDSL